jgi:hypothetical protein
MKKKLTLFFSIVPRTVIASVLFIAAATVTFITVLSASAVAQSAPTNNRLPVTHQHFNSLEAMTQLNHGVVSVANSRNPPSPICSTTTSNATNVDTDCEFVGFHNETTIAVNPTNALNLIGSANEFQVRALPGSLYLTLYSRAHASFDGGRTWTTYPIYENEYVATGDPAVAFDGAGTAYLASLGFVLGVNADVIVAHSTDGGKNWSAPKRVASGSGAFLKSPGVFNDKEYIAAWGNGNAIVTWTAAKSNLGKGGLNALYFNSAIFASVTHDGGNSWSEPTEISGSAPFCIGGQGGTKCDQDTGSVPTVAADGSIYVAFLNYATSDSAGRDQYLVVKVDANTGQRAAGPYKVSSVYDGFTDYPIGAFGRLTYQDSQFRTWPLGNITADPTNAAHLAVIWSDMRNSTLPAPSDPYAAVTNSDIIVSQSFNRGATWSAPTPLSIQNDQFMPWGAYDASGKLRIGYFDRSYDAANHKYGYTLATETTPGTLTFATTQLSTVLSDPTQGVTWFLSGDTQNPAFPNPTTFLGDYSGISLGGTAALWTDMRVNTCLVFCGAGEDAFFGAAP